MTGKEYLKDYKRLNHQVGQTDRAIQELRNQTLLHGDRISDFIPQIVDKERALTDLVMQKVDRQSEIFRGILQIDDFLQQEIMLARYIQGKTWPDIAAEMGISEGYCYAIHRKALLAFDQIFHRRKDGETPC